MRQARGIAVYGRCRDREGRVLLTRASADGQVPGAWLLPGGGIAHGEHPADAVVREFAEQTGLDIAVSGVHTVVSDVLPWRGSAWHTDRVVYEVAVRGGELRRRPGGTVDRAAWLAEDEAATLPLMSFTAELLGLPVRPTPAVTRPTPAAAVPGSSVPGSSVPVSMVGDGRGSASSSSHLPTGRRFGAYGLVTDRAGRVLLTLIADGFPGAGQWHLPGGGTDHGEQPVAGLLRELIEEADQVGRLIGLLDVSHRHSQALGPEGHLLDWHTVRVLYRVVVDEPAPPRVTEAAGGSTARAAWFTAAQAHALPLTEIATVALGMLARDEAGAPALDL